MYQPFKRLLRIVSFLISLTLFAVTITSCGSNLPTLNKNNPVSVNIWHHYLGEQKIMFDKLVAEFNQSEGANKGITVKAYSMDNTGDIHVKLMASVNGEPGSLAFPEMATAYPGTAYTLYHMEKLISLDKYMDQEVIDKYVPSFIEDGRLTPESGIVIFPVAKSTEALYINDTFYKAFIDEYNKSNPAKKLTEELLTTFEGIQETAEAYYKWTDEKTPGQPNDGKALCGFDAASNFAIVGYKQLESDFFNINNDNTGDIDLNSPAMSSIWNEYFVPMVKGYYGAYSFYRSEDVQTGDLVMYTGSTAGASFFPKTVTFADNTKQDVELKVMPYPSFQNGKKVAAKQGAGVIVTKSSPEKEFASVVFLKWLTEPKRNIDFVLKTGYLPVTKEAIEKTLPEELQKYEEMEEYKNVSKVIKATLEMMESYELYANKPFKSSDDIRYSFEEKLLAYTIAAREEMVKNLRDGRDFKDSVSSIINDKSFDQFLTEVRHEVLKAK